jgi:undecaprenyl diphosphate synthase
MKIKEKPDREKVRGGSRPEKAKAGKEPEVDIIPVHVAIIMDGNGRWAEKRRLARIMGHQEGLKAVRQAITTADDSGVRYLTLYSFSSENWKRPDSEVNFIFHLMKVNLEKESLPLHGKNVRVRFIGRRQPLPESLRKAMSDIESLTSANTGLTLVFAINYGGRQEIADAVRMISEKGYQCRKIDEKLIENFLYTSGIPDPDLIIRTSGENRLSNFLLWQSAYSELYFTPVLWPDFTGKEFRKALDSYQKRKRRFGGITR